jgi:hypothetical protein
MSSGVLANDQVQEIFTRGRHLGLTGCLILQNLFPSGSNSTKYARNVLLNSCLFFLFKMRDINQIRQFALQCFGKGLSEFIVNSYIDAMKKPFNYLLLDLQDKTETKYSVKSAVLGESEEQILYLKNGDIITESL